MKLRKKAKWNVEDIKHRIKVKKLKKALHNKEKIREQKEEKELIESFIKAKQEETEAAQELQKVEEQLQEAEKYGDADEIEKIKKRERNYN